VAGRGIEEIAEEMAKAGMTVQGEEVVASLEGGGRD
jgi:hypothetical protein